MDDFNFWWYIIAAVIYFLSRGRKRKQAKPNGPASDGNPQKGEPKSFEELLREIKDGRQKEAEDPFPQRQRETQNELIEKEKREKSIKLEGERRVFADEESKRVYEESIKMAEGTNLKSETDEHFAGSRLSKQKNRVVKSTSYTKELMDGIDLNEAKKAIIYSEIFNRKY
ncbi:MAG: hypothetical protein AAF600_18425 [Bacteroidota bacterium]